MDTLGFVQQVLPAGLVVIVCATEQGMRHHVFPDAVEAVEFAQGRAAVSDVYFGLGTLRERSVFDAAGKTRIRIKDNISQMQAFWLDLDVGEGPKKYATQREATDALRDFIRATGLPLPTIVNSGYGVHVYWPSAYAIDRDDWLLCAGKLKHLCAKHGLHADPARTADCASILRLPGTINHKGGGRKAVSLVRESVPSDMVSLIHAITPDGAPVPVRSEPPVAGSLLAAVGTPTTTYKDVDGKAVVTACPQMRAIATSGGDVSEPLWYAAIQVSVFFKNGDKAAHLLSRGHAGYSAEATSAKFNQVVASGVGPTLCTTFDDRCPGVCPTCPFYGKVSTPVALGRREVSTPVVIEGHSAEMPPPPAPWKRNERGIFLEQTSDDGVPSVTNVYAYDTYPCRRIYDESLQEEFFELCTHTPHDGLRTFSVPSSTLYDMKALSKLLASKGMYPRQDMMIYLAGYIVSYIQELQRLAKADRLLATMGWDGCDFALGPVQYKADGNHVVGGIGAQAKGLAAELRKAGSMEAWREVVGLYNTKGMEAQAFVFATAFGAPLLRFTGLRGAVLSMVGSTGSGKSTVQKAVASVYGVPDRGLFINCNATHNAIMSTLGVVKSLPLCFDEGTNVEPKAMSQLVYDISQGMGRARVNRTGELRERSESQTLAIFSTNRSLVDILTAFRTDASAELARVFEVRVDRTNHLNPIKARAAFRELDKNYGHAGGIYIAALVKNQSEVEARVTATMDALYKKCRLQSDDRFYAAIVACNMVGASLANHLGLTQFNLERMKAWAIDKLSGANDARASLVSLPQDVMQDYVAAQELATCHIERAYGKGYLIKSPNVHAMTCALEVSEGHLFVMRSGLRKYFASRNMDYTLAIERLIADGVVIKDSVNPDLPNIGRQRCVLVDWSKLSSRAVLSVVGAIHETRSESKATS